MMKARRKKKKGEDDSAFVKYFLAFRRMKKSIEDGKLQRFKDRWDKNQVRLVFFTNRTLPLIEDKSGKITLKGHPDVALTRVEKKDMPLNTQWI